MPIKRIPTDDEVAVLAESFGKLWKDGDVVRPWLRRHSAMLIELVHGDWSWEAIARAMTKAGITYRTGKPWTARWLQSDFYRARAPLKGPARNRARHSRHQTTGFQPEPLIAEQGRPPIAEPPVDSNHATAPLPSSAMEPERSAVRRVEDPEFLPVTLKPYAPPPAQSEEQRARAEATRKKVLGY